MLGSIVHSVMQSIIVYHDFPDNSGKCPKRDSLKQLCYDRFRWAAETTGVLMEIRQ